MTEPDARDRGNGGVTYSIRELLGEIKANQGMLLGKVDHIDEKIDTKAEKSAVEALVLRLSVIETSRMSEMVYGQQLIREFREMQKGYQANREAITILQTQKKDKDASNLLWIPTLASLVGVVVLAIKQFV